MERAKAFIVDACLAEGDKFFHDIDDVGGAHDAFYGFSVYHSFSDFKKSRGVPEEAKFKYEVGGGLFWGALSALLRGLKSQQSRAQAGALGTMPPHPLRPVGEK